MGNIKFRYFVSTFVDMYESSTAEEKCDITMNIVQRLKRDIHVKFLKKDGTYGWMEVDDDVARLKVSHVFRSLRREKNMKQEQQQQQQHCRSDRHKLQIHGKRTSEQMETTMMYV